MWYTLIFPNVICQCIPIKKERETLKATSIIERPAYRKCFEGCTGFGKVDVLKENIPGRRKNSTNKTMDTKTYRMCSKKMSNRRRFKIRLDKYKMRSKNAFQPNFRRIEDT